MGWFGHVVSSKQVCVLCWQNQLQRLRTEEVLRQQVNLQRRLEGDGEDEEEDESSNSTTSSPCLQHKEEPNTRYSPPHTHTHKSTQIILLCVWYSYQGT